MFADFSRFQFGQRWRLTGVLAGRERLYRHREGRVTFLLRALLTFSRVVGLVSHSSGCFLAVTRSGWRQLIQSCLDPLQFWFHGYFLPLCSNHQLFNSSTTPWYEVNAPNES